MYAYRRFFLTVLPLKRKPRKASVTVDESVEDSPDFIEVHTDTPSKRKAPRAHASAAFLPVSKTWSFPFHEQKRCHRPGQLPDHCRLCRMGYGSAGSRYPYLMRLPYYIGCPSWSENAWREYLYPVDARSNDYLGLYSQVFNAVEGNTTFTLAPRPPLCSAGPKSCPMTFASPPNSWRYQPCWRFA